MDSSTDHITNNLYSRGQTGFDFLVGMSVFLVTIGLVFAFVPGMFQPFETDTGPDMVVAERSASLLAEDLLVEDVSRPTALDANCTADFFDDDPDDPGCRFDENGTDLHAALGVDEFAGLNVTIESGGAVMSVDGGGGPVAASAGRPPPATSDVVIGKRGVIVDGEQGVLHVRVW